MLTKLGISSTVGSVSKGRAIYRIGFITTDICFFFDIICHKSTATATLALVPLSTVEPKDQGSIVTGNRGDKNL